MQTSARNPLSGYFRQPAIFLTLPSKGRWWEPDSLELSENGDIAVYPMSAKDEITIRTPDALLNGQGVVNVIQSCCPNIKNAWKMPSVDIDAVLISIRIATYGSNMSFDSTCPHCKAANTHEIDLGAPLTSIKCPNFDQTVKYRDLVIKLRPQHYFEANRINMIGYEEQKILATLSNESLDDETRIAQVTIIMQKIVEIGIEGCVNSTEYIQLPNGDRIINKEHLNEFYHNAEKTVVASVQEAVGAIAAESKIPEIQLSCDECSSTYSAELTFDYSNFFAKGS